MEGACNAFSPISLSNRCLSLLTSLYLVTSCTLWGMGGTVFVALGLGRDRERERGERETRGYEAFALHAAIHWALLGGVSNVSSLTSLSNRCLCLSSISIDFLLYKRSTNFSLYRRFLFLLYKKSYVKRELNRKLSAILSKLSPLETLESCTVEEPPWRHHEGKWHLPKVDTPSECHLIQVAF